MAEGSAPALADPVRTGSVGTGPVPTDPAAGDPAAGRPPAGVGVVAALLGGAAGSVGLRIGEVAGVPLFALLVGVALVVAAVAARRRLRTLRPTALDAVFVAYVVVRVVAERLDSPATGAMELGTVADLVVGYAAVWAARLAVGRAVDLPRFLTVLVATSVPVSVLAVLQIADVPGVNRLLLATTDSRGLAVRVAEGRDIRATSTIGHWTNLGGYLLGMITLGCLALVTSRTWRRPGLLVVVALAVVAQLATLTFAPLLVTVVVLAWTAHRLRLRAVAVVAAVGVAAAVGAVLLGGLVQRRVVAQLSRRSSGSGPTGWLPETVAFRVEVWRRQTLPAIEARPWTGWGNGLYQPGFPRPAYLRWVSPESEWLRVAVQAGVPAALVLLALLLLVLHRARLAARADRAWGVLAVYVVGLMVVSTVHSHLSDRGTPLVLWVATGLLLARTTVALGPLHAAVPVDRSGDDPADDLAERPAESDGSVEPPTPGDRPGPTRAAPPGPRARRARRTAPYAARRALVAGSPTGGTP